MSRCYCSVILAGYFVFAALVSTVPLLAQGKPDSTAVIQSDPPAKVVQNFKAALNKEDYASICALMAEDDGSGPLKRVHYEQTQRSLEGLVKLWRGVPFQYGMTEFQTEGEITRATVFVSILNLRQDVKFVLLKFGDSWYVFDIEIYFK